MNYRGGLVSVVRRMQGRYYIRITMRDFHGQTADDYHATVTRISDDVQLVFISEWKWLLDWKLQRSTLDRAFKQYDKMQQKKVRAIENRVV